MAPIGDSFSGPVFHSLEMLWFEFRREFEHLSQFLNVLKIVDEAYARKVDEASDALDPADSDMGEVYYEATKLLGLDPYEAANHVGLMLLARATGLYETYLARIAAKFFIEPEGIVYYRSKSWSRDEADQFFWTCLARPIRPWRGAMSSISQIRDLYAHGYGEPLSVEQATALARDLWELARADEPPSKQEVEIGFGEGAHLFGPFDKYSPQTGIEALAFSTVRFSLSPLATHRLLNRVEEAASDVFEAASWSLREGLDSENSSFVRNWQKKVDGRRS